MFDPGMPLAILLKYGALGALRNHRPDEPTDPPPITFAQIMRWVQPATLIALVVFVYGLYRDNVNEAARSATERGELQAKVLVLQAQITQLQSDNSAQDHAVAARLDAQRADIRSIQEQFISHFLNDDRRFGNGAKK